MRVVLYQPEIPQNTGNIGRVCVATQTPLYLIRPLGFQLDSKAIRRSGLDYWPHLDIHVLNSWTELREQFPDQQMCFLSTKGTRRYTDVRYQSDALLIFGNESSGLSDELYAAARQEDSLISIPMWGPVRSLNLATSVGIVLYEAYRQQGKC